MAFELHFSNSGNATPSRSRVAIAVGAATGLHGAPRPFPESEGCHVQEEAPGTWFRSRVGAERVLRRLPRLPKRHPARTRCLQGAQLGNEALPELLAARREEQTPGRLTSRSETFRSLRRPSEPGGSMTRPSVRLRLGLSIAVLILWALAPRVARAEPKGSEPVHGRWLVDFRPDGSVELTMKRRSSSGSDNWTSSDDFTATDFDGLHRPTSSADVAASFRMVRDAGTITFEGQLNDSGGSGRFAFQSNPDYLAALAKMGYATPMADEAFALAVHDVSRKFMGELASLGYTKLPLDDLISMKIHGATPQFIRALEALGYDHLAADDLVSMRIHGATPEFIQEIKAAGYDHLSADDLVSMRIHGVTPDFIKEMKGLAGGERLEADDLVSLRIHGATPEFVHEMEGLGYHGLSADDVVSMRIHGVTPDFVRDLQALGYKDVSADDLVSMRIHGVSVDYVKRMKARYKNVSIDELVDMKIHGKG
jgi:hypothetical protein